MKTLLKTDRSIGLNLTFGWDGAKSHMALQVINTKLNRKQNRKKPPKLMLKTGLHYRVILNLKFDVAKDNNNIKL